jgi:hypothetical protein
MPATVLFVCAHGAGKSRMAAAWFNADPAPGWRATSAGVEPQLSVSLHAPRLLAGTAAASTLDHATPRRIDAVEDAAVTIAIDCVVPGGVDWRLSHVEFDAGMAEEIRRRVAALVAELRAGRTPSATPIRVDPGPP